MAPLPPEGPILVDSSGSTHESVGALCATLLPRARRLSEEVISYQAYLTERAQADKVDLRRFKSNIQTELESLERLGEALSRNAKDVWRRDQDGGEVDSQLHMLHSSNLPFYEAVWAVSKSCIGVTALAKRIHWHRLSRDRTCLREGPGFSTNKPGLVPGKRHASAPQQKKDILIDIVAENGMEWVKVSTVTEKRLLFDMAKEGWEAYDDHSDSASDTIKECQFRGRARGSGLGLVRMAEDMEEAALAVRIHYRHPKIRFILPNIQEGKLNDIDVAISNLRATGAVVECNGAASRAGMLKGAKHMSIDHDTFTRMQSSTLPQLTASLNIDCTILLALISDISHISEADLPPPPSGLCHSAVAQQITSEANRPLLTTELYPLCGGRDLVCTSHAAQRMREIVATMGSPAEKARADIILSEDSAPPHDLAGRSDALQRLSTHPVPNELKLPITVMTFDAQSVLEGSTPAPHMSVQDARKVCKNLGLSEINQSVFLYGWHARLVTVTSNRAVAVGIESNVGAALDARRHGGAPQHQVHKTTSAHLANLPEERIQETLGPGMWICRTARSLIGKEKSRTDRTPTER